MQSRAVRLAGLKKIETVERDLQPASGEVIVKTGQASICDADLRAYRGLHMPSDLPSFEWLGHEGGGEIVEIGSGVREFKPGDKVMCFGPNNSWSTFFKSPIRAVLRVPDGMETGLAYLGEPIAVGMFGVFQSGVQLGDTACVAGLNFQGLIAVQGLKKKGAKKLIAIDYSDKHLSLAGNLGADILINTSNTNAVQEIREATSGRGADVVFHSCGYWNPNAEEYFNLCAEVVRDEGIFVSIPDIMSPIKANLHRLHHHAIDVRFPAIMHHGPEYMARWVPRVLRPISEGVIDIGSLVTGTYSLNDVEKAISSFHEDPDHVKILLDPSTN
jgi:threonine dehydrogenase-like Zn-dependent dehydrogenase